MSNIIDTIDSKFATDAEAIRTIEMDSYATDMEISHVEILHNIEQTHGKGSAGEFATLHTVSVVEDMIARHICGDPAIFKDASRYLLASTACQCLAELYQAMGKDNMD